MKYCEIDFYILCLFFCHRVMLLTLCAHFFPQRGVAGAPASLCPNCARTGFRGVAKSAPRAPSYFPEGRESSGRARSRAQRRPAIVRLDEGPRRRPGWPPNSVSDASRTIPARHVEESAVRRGAGDIQRIPALPGWRRPLAGGVDRAEGAPIMELLDGIDDCGRP